jgi:O-acetyl-ADP-ribose deacetylase (regulator of RNase III)
MAILLKRPPPIAIASVKEFLAEEDHRIETVYFVCFSDEDLEVYERLLKS